MWHIRTLQGLRSGLRVVIVRFDHNGRSVEMQLDTHVHGCSPRCNKYARERKLLTEGEYLLQVIVVEGSTGRYVS